MALNVQLFEGAKPPTRAHATDVGFDLTAVAGTIEGVKHTYDTMLAVSPPPGYYCEVVPRSSISRYGLVLSNSVGIIDPDYRGTVRLVFYKIDPTRPDPELPARLAQVVVRPMCVPDLSVVDTLPNPVTDRGTGGFGSSGA